MLKQLVSMIQDGEGNTSSMRVVMILVVACVMIPPVVAALRTGGTVQWSASDIELVASVVAGKVGQGFLESKPATPPTQPSVTSNIPKVQ